MEPGMNFAGVENREAFFTELKALCDRYNVRATEEAPVSVESESARRQQVIDAFHKLWYDQGNLSWNGDHAPLRVNWMGVDTQKCPLDAWIYQEIIYETRPSLIVEAGTHKGGSALFLAMICEGMHNGSVLSIDNALQKSYPEHPRLRFVCDDILSEEMYRRVVYECRHKSVMFIFDDDHTGSHVLAEMEAYAHLVSPGQYMIVEDTNVNGHPIWSSFGPGPYEAVEKFLLKHEEFEIDKSREKFLLTMNPNGYLRKK